MEIIPITTEFIRLDAALKLSGLFSMISSISVKFFFMVVPSVWYVCSFVVCIFALKPVFIKLIRSHKCTKNKSV